MAIQNQKSEQIINQSQFAHELAMEYFKQNNLFPKSIDGIDDMIKDFAEVEQAFYTSINKYHIMFKKLPNPTLSH